tara:strand:+ start:263 stop:439 length:177 start_codon:yes stop_codon:yes gene_type:complete
LEALRLKNILPLEHLGVELGMPPQWASMKKYVYNGVIFGGFSSSTIEKFVDFLRKVER